MHTESFEIKLNYEANTGSADRIYLAMAAYVSAFESLTLVVGRSVDSELNYTYQLSNIEIGSLKSIIKCGAGLPKMAQALASIPRMIAQSMVEIEEIDSEDDIEQTVGKVEAELRELGITEFPNEININRLNYAKSIKRLQEASQHLVNSETISVGNCPSNVIQLNTNFRFDKDPESLYIEIITTVKRNETLMIKRPCFIGSSRWEFKSIERNHSFSASIEHESWLKKYQDRNLGHLDPGDGLIALISYDAVKKKGIEGFKHRNEKVLLVDRIIRANEIQLVIKEINSSEK
jgi:hypothetical protein